MGSGGGGKLVGGFPEIIISHLAQVRAVEWRGKVREARRSGGQPSEPWQPQSVLKLGFLLSQPQQVKQTFAQHCPMGLGPKSNN